MPDAPDRDELADLLRDVAARLADLNQDECRSVLYAGVAAAAKWLAEPAVPPSVAEAREAVVNELADALDEDARCDDDRVSIREHASALADALIAAVHAATAAEAVRVVEAVPRYVLGLNLWQGTAPTMEPAANGAWIGQAEAMSALRALGGQP